MEIVDRVWAPQNYQNVSDVIAKGTKKASKNTEPTKSE